MYRMLSARSVAIPWSIVATLLLAGALPAWPQSGEDEVHCETSTGGLLITPKRVVFAGRDRSAEVQLMNRGCEATTYRVELIELRMEASGRLLPTVGSDEWALGRMVRFAPRQVALAPGERQTVRLFLRKPAELVPGEYRSHLQLRALPQARELDPLEVSAGEEGGFVLRLTALPAMTIPVIVRHGALAATVELSDVVVDTSAAVPRVSLRLDRAGERSVYGDLTAEYLPSSGEAIPVGVGKGIAVYTTVSSRAVSLPLAPPAGVELIQGRLRVVFRSRPDGDGGGEALWASHEVVLP